MRTVYLLGVYIFLFHDRMREAAPEKNKGYAITNPLAVKESFFLLKYSPRVPTSHPELSLLRGAPPL